MNDPHETEVPSFWRMPESSETMRRLRRHVIRLDAGIRQNDSESGVYPLLTYLTCCQPIL